MAKRDQSEWSYFMEEQKRLFSEAVQDPENRKLVLLALGGGVVSTLALSRLYTKMTPGVSEDEWSFLLPKTLTAVGVGLLAVLWNVNKAYRPPSYQLEDSFETLVGEEEA
jgi:hypothetical protein